MDKTLKEELEAHLVHLSQLEKAALITLFHKVYEDGFENGHTDGYESGYEDGHDNGHEEGYDEGYEQWQDDGDGTEAQPIPLTAIKAPPTAAPTVPVEPVIEEIEVDDVITDAPAATPPPLPIGTSEKDG